jgi:hypothetical protein
MESHHRVEHSDSPMLFNIACDVIKILAAYGLCTGVVVRFGNVTLRMSLSRTRGAVVKGGCGTFSKYGSVMLP